MASIYDWSTTAASNASVGSINWSEGQAPSSLNDSARYEMADVAKWRDLLGAAKISSGTDTIALTSGLSISAYAQGMMFAFEAGGANTGAATLNVDTVGAKDIKKFHDVALASGDIEAGGIYLVAYEASADNFQLLSAVSNAPIGNVSEDTTPTLGGALDGADNTASAINFKDVAWVHEAHGDTSGADIAIDLNDGNYHSMTISTDAVTMSFTNWVATDELQYVLMKVVNGASQTLNWPSECDYEGGAVAWTFSTSGTDFVLAWTDDGGTIVHMQQVSIGSA